TGKGRGGEKGKISGGPVYLKKKRSTNSGVSLDGFTSWRWWRISVCRQSTRAALRQEQLSSRFALTNLVCLLLFFSSRRRHTRLVSDWSSDVCSSDPRRRRHTRLVSDWSSDVCS